MDEGMDRVDRVDEEQRGKAKAFSWGRCQDAPGNDRTAKNLLPQSISSVFSTLHLFAMTVVSVHCGQGIER
jgi:hypothetical protein